MSPHERYGPALASRRKAEPEPARRRIDQWTPLAIASLLSVAFIGVVVILDALDGHIEDTSLAAQDREPSRCSSVR